MSENLVIVSTVEQAKNRYNLKSNELIMPIKIPSIISSGDMAWVITSKDPRTLISMNFGFTGHSSESRTDILIIQSDDISNKDKDHDYDRLMGIFAKPHLSEPIVSFRCAVIVDAFLVTSYDNTNYLIHMQNHERPFALAGIYDHWQDPKTGIYHTGFAILTAEANPMLKRIGVNFMPVILNKNNVFTWLDLRCDRRKVYSLIHTYPDDMMNGYPVSGKIFSSQCSKDNLLPIGLRLKS